MGNAAPDRLDRRDLRAALSALGVVAIVQALWFVQIGPVDPINYWEFSLDPWGNVVDGQSTVLLPNHGATRMGIVLPLYAASHVLGHGLIAYHSVALAHSVLLVVSTFLVARALFDRGVAVIAASTIGVIFPVLSASTQVLPDNLGTSWLVASVAAVLYSRSSAWRVRAAGVLFGIGYLSREEQVVLGPLVLALVIVMSRPGWRRGAADFLVGCATVVAVEAVLLSTIFGTPLARILSLLAHGDGSDADLIAYGKGATVWTVLRRGPQVIMGANIGIVLIVALVVAAVLGLRDARQRTMTPWVILSAWWVLWWLYIVVMAGLLDPQHPKLRDNQLRYWSQLMPVAVICTSALVVRLSRAIAQRTASVRPVVVTAALSAVLVALPVASDLRIITRQTAWVLFRPTPMSQTGGYLAAREGEVRDVWMPYRASRMAIFFTRDPWGRVTWTGTVHAYNKNSPAAERGLPLMHYSYALNRGKLNLPMPDDLKVPEQRTLLGDCSTGFCLVGK